MARPGRDAERGQSLVIVLGLITFLFLVGTALAAHVSVALRSTVASDAQSDAFHAADAGTELGIWWQRNGRSGNPPSISINGVTATTTIARAGGGCPTATPILIAGFEHGAVSSAGGGLFSGLRGSGVTADAAVKRSGGWSLQIDASARDYGTLDAPAGVVVARIYLRLAALPSGNVSELLIVDLASGSDLLVGYLASTQRLTLRFGSGTQVQATTAIAAGAWVRLDLRVTADTDPRQAEWQVDGVAQPAVSAAESSSSVTSLRLGSNVASDKFVANYDDVVASATAGDYPIGDGSVLPLRPDGVGVHATPGSFRNDDATAIDSGTPSRLDDDPLTATVDYVYQQTIGAGSYVETTFADSAAPCIGGVSGIVAYRSAGTALNNGKTSVMDGTREMIVYQGDMSGTSLTYRSALLPRTGGWTTAAVAGLVARIGASTDVTPLPYWDALLLEVSTSGAGTPATITVTSSAGGSTVVTTYVDAGASAPTLLTWTADR